MVKTSRTPNRNVRKLGFLLGITKQPSGISGYLYGKEMPLVHVLSLVYPVLVYGRFFGKFEEKEVGKCK